MKQILALFLTLSLLAFSLVAQTKPRARDLGIPFDGNPGQFNAITDVKGVEVGYAILLLSAFVLPAWTNSFRVPALVIATALATGHALLDRRRGPLPAAILVYAGIYVLAGLHSERDTFDIVQAGQLLAVPVFALAVAWAAHEPETRRNLVVISLVAVAIQVPVTIAEVIAEGRSVTYDMKPTRDDPTAVGTSEVADAIIEKLEVLP
mgnify:CR=1 FL=1